MRAAPRRAISAAMVNRPRKCRCSARWGGCRPATVKVAVDAVAHRVADRVGFGQRAARRDQQERAGRGIIASTTTARVNVPPQMLVDCLATGSSPVSVCFKLIIM
jgi:hypothetical protein